MTEAETQKQLILIYTMGKVGSWAISNACDTLSDRYETHHAHHITAVPFNPEIHLHNNAGVLHKKLIEPYVSDPNAQIKIIHLVRDPIGRTLSHFFTNHKFHSEDLENYQDQKVIDYLAEHFMAYPWHEEFPVWEKKEIKRFTGLNWLKYPFDTSKNWRRITTKRYDILSFICELPTRDKLALVNDFLRADIPSLRFENTTADKTSDATGLLYRSFKQNVRLPRKFVDKIYNNKVVRHYYSDKQIAKFKHRWTAGLNS